METAVKLVIVMFFVAMAAYTTMFLLAASPYIIKAVAGFLGL